MHPSRVTRQSVLDQLVLMTVTNISTDRCQMAATYTHCHRACRPGDVLYTSTFKKNHQRYSNSGAFAEGMLGYP